MKKLLTLCLVCLACYYSKAQCSANFGFTTDSTLTACFQDSSSNPYYWYWDFNGDDTTDATLPNPCWTFPAAGSYNVRLVIQDSALTCSDTMWKLVTVPSSGCNGYANFWTDPDSLDPKTIRFWDSSWDDSGIASWFWDFGDTTTSTIQSPLHTYIDTGSYLVCLTVTDFDSCTYSKCEWINVGVTPSCNGWASFWTDPDSLDPKTIQFYDASWDDSGIISWNWNFGDTYFDTIKDPVHIYADTGSYWVCLDVTDSSGCTYNYCMTVNIGAGGGCFANFSHWVDTSNTAHFTDMSSTGVISWYWDFGDSAFSAAQNPPHTYSAPGSYWVCLTIWDSVSGCSSTWCDSVIVGTTGAFCNADFNFWKDTTNTVFFTDYSTGSITNWYWDFGDSTSSTLQNPTHTYAGAGTYGVCLTVWSDTSCTDTWCQPVVIDPNISCFTLSTSVTNASCAGSCDGEAAVNISGGIPPFTYSWDDLANTASAAVSGLCEGSYSVTVTDSNGCLLSGSVLISAPAALSLSFTTNDVTCGSADGSATVTVSGGTPSYTYLWNDPNTQTTNTAMNLSVGNYTVNVTDASGCTASGVATINSIGGPVISTVAVNDVTTCAGGNNGSIDISVSGDTLPFTYSWSNGAATQDISNLSAGNYAVTVTDSNGCMATENYNISEPGDLSFSMETTDANCGGSNGTATVHVTGGSSPYTYQWSSGGTDSIETGLSAGAYTVVVTDNNGCADTATAVVSDIGSATVIAVISDISCFGAMDGAIDITVTGGSGSYVYSWSNGNTSQDISGLDAGNYFVIVSDFGTGCNAVKSFTINEPDEISTTISSVNATCSNADGSATVYVNGGTAPYTYSWDNGDSTATITGLTAGDYIITVTDTNGCTDPDTAKIVTIIETPPTPSICLVTIDSITEKNLVVWEKSDPTAVYYKIYKESTTSGVYDFIDSVLVTNLSTYADMASSPVVKSARYKISTVDACGNESELSAAHKTLHLTTNLGNNNTINLIWELYEGFTFYTYRIWKGTSKLNLVLTDSVQNTFTSWTDTMPTPGDTSFYVVEVVHPTGCTPTAAKVLTYNSAQSNVSNRMTPTGIDEMQVSDFGFQVYPNPYSGQTEIAYTLTEKAHVMLEVLNVLGKKVKTVVDKVQNAGKYLYRFGGSETGSSSGIFVLKLIVNDKVYTKRLVELK